MTNIAKESAALILKQHFEFQVSVKYNLSIEICLFSIRLHLTSTSTSTSTAKSIYFGIEETSKNSPLRKFKSGKV